MLEILVVLAIVGLLVGLTVTKMTGILDKSQVDVAEIFVNSTMKTPLTAYRLDMGDYPSTAEGLKALVEAPANKADRWRQPYLDVKGGKLPLDPWKQEYMYRYPGVKNKGGYDLWSKGKDQTDGTADDIGNW